MRRFLPLLLANLCLAQYDVLIQGGRVVDGAGGPWFLADVALKGDKIAASTTYWDMVTLLTQLGLMPST